MLGHLCEALRGKYAGDEIINFGIDFVVKAYGKFRHDRPVNTVNRVRKHQASHNQ